MDKEITIKELADRVCFSSDHFTKSFKKTIGVPPLEYINLKRIEKAQLLLVTTNLLLKGIIGKTGFNSSSYFNRICKNITGSTPLAYRRSHFGIF